MPISLCTTLAKCGNQRKETASQYLHNTSLPSLEVDHGSWLERSVGINHCFLTCTLETFLAFEQNECTLTEENPRVHHWA